MKSIRLAMLVWASSLVLSSLGVKANEPSKGAAPESAAEEKSYGIPQPVSNPAVAVRPLAPELVSPSFMEKISGATATLKWNAGTGATLYHLQVAKDPNFKWPIVDETQFAGTTYEVKGLEAQKHYYWRVFSRNEGQDAGYTTSMPAKSMFQTQ